MAAKGVHASPKVTTSCPVDECLSFLVETSWAALQGRTALGTRKHGLPRNMLKPAVLSIQEGRLSRHGWKLRQENFNEFEATLGLPSCRMACRGRPCLKKKEDLSQSKLKYFPQTVEQSAILPPTSVHPLLFLLRTTHFLFLSSFLRALQLWSSHSLKLMAQPQSSSLPAHPALLIPYLRDWKL